MLVVLLLALSEVAISAEAVLIANGIKYRCLTYAGSSEVDLSTCIGVIGVVDITMDTEDSGGGVGAPVIGSGSGPGNIGGGGDGGDNGDVTGGDNNGDSTKLDEPIGCDCEKCDVCKKCLIGIREIPTSVCEYCDCPPAPTKINLCDGGQATLYNIVTWLEHMCALKGINANFSINTETMVDVTKCIGNAAGTAGAYVNGAGYINGIGVRWQVSYAGYPDTDKNLSFGYTYEPQYYRAILKQNGNNNEPGITLLFESSEHRDKVVGNIPCF